MKWTAAGCGLRSTPHQLAHSTRSIGRSPRRLMYAHVDHAAARRAAEPHTGRQRPGRRHVVDLKDLPRRHTALAVEVSAYGADRSAHREDEAYCVFNGQW